MKHYTSITIIFNPHSTGNSEDLAKETQKELRQALKEQKISIVATKHAGHAEELAYKLAKESKRPLIISSSGDGGYNEVVNGAMRAKKEGAKPVTGLLPAGNANDHFHSLHVDGFVDSVVHNRVLLIDVLNINARSSGKEFKRYAHSYIGLGLTPHVGRKLNNTDLNRFKETFIAVKSFLEFRHVKLVVKDNHRPFRSMLFSNIDRMAKVLTLTKESEVDDGKFEVSLLQHRSKLHFALSLLKATLPGLYSTSQTDEYHFRTIKSTLVQLDGEVIRLDADSEATILIDHKALECIV